MNTLRSEAEQMAVAAVEGWPHFPFAWLLDDGLHRAWNVRLTKSQGEIWTVGLLICDVRFSPPVLLWLTKTIEHGEPRYETQALVEADPSRAIAAIEEREAVIAAKSPDLHLSGEWLTKAGTEQWMPVADTLNDLRSRGLLSGEYRTCEPGEGCSQEIAPPAAPGSLH